MEVAGALFARWRGWRPSGAFRLQGWGWPVNLAALVYGLAAIANMAWPRTPDAAWYADYAVLLSTAAVIGSGVLYMMLARPFGSAAVLERQDRVT
jgi:hypothetical protein